MKRVLWGLFLALSVSGFVGCAAPDDGDEESLRERCYREPQLPECSESPDITPEDTPSMGDDFQHNPLKGPFTYSIFAQV